MQVRKFYANDFLPAYHQGVAVIPVTNPIPNHGSQKGTAYVKLQQLELGLASELNANT